MTAAVPATKQDVEEIVGRVVGEIIGDALQMITARFDQVDERFEQMDRRFDRLEDKLETTSATVDHHAIDIRELRRKAA
jgi:archaellum component FlaC